MNGRVNNVVAVMALAALVVGISAVPAFAPPVSVEESNPSVSYAWRTVLTKKAWGGSYTTERSAGARATYTFSGRSLRLITVFGPDQGTATVKIDGSSYGTIDSYNPKTLFGGWHSFSALSAGSHTIVITVDGKKGSSAGTGTFFSIDAMQPGGGALQKTPAVNYRWRIGPNPIASGGHYAFSDQRGAAANLTFMGTTIDWYTVMGSASGKAAIYIDGVLKTTVDTYRSSTTVGFIHIAGLSNATHTIKIVNAGTKSAASHGTYVTLDRFVAG